MRSFNSYITGVLPANPPPLDLTAFINNYYLLRSFQKNWSSRELLHITVPRPALRDIAAGEHYFEWRIPGNPKPVVAVTLFACPAINSSNPFCFSNTSPRFDRKSIYVFYHTIPSYIPIFVEDELLQLGNKISSDLSDFLRFLDLFVEDFYRPTSPITTQPPTIPLEDY